MSFLSQFLHLLRHTEQREPHHHHHLLSSPLLSRLPSFLFTVNGRVVESESKLRFIVQQGMCQGAQILLRGEGVIFLMRDLQMDVLCLCDSVNPLHLKWRD